MVGTGLATAPHPLGPWTRWQYPDGRLGGPVMNLTGAANFPGNREGDYVSQAQLYRLVCKIECVVCAGGRDGEWNLPDVW